MFWDNLETTFSISPPSGLILKVGHHPPPQTTQGTSSAAWWKERLADNSSAFCLFPSFGSLLREVGVAGLGPLRHCASEADYFRALTLYVHPYLEGYVSRCDPPGSVEQYRIRRRAQVGGGGGWGSGVGMWVCVWWG